MYKLLIKMQMYLINRKTKQIKECLGCGTDVVPRKEVSTLNILGFLIFAALVFFLTKNKLSFFIPVVLGTLNGVLVKPRCPKCRSTSFGK